MFVMEYTLRPSLRKTEEKHMLEMQKTAPKSPAEDKRRKEMQRHENIRDSEILKQMWIFALDNVYCGTLREVEAEPWASVWSSSGRPRMVVRQIFPNVAADVRAIKVLTPYIGI
jgi:hypothetical protein